MKHELDIAAFRVAYPAFTNATAYPDAYIQSTWDLGTSFLSAYDDRFLCGDDRQNALNLMTAHLLQTMGPPARQAAGGGSNAMGAKTSATIDKVTVQRVAPPAKSAWAYWLGSTTYGVMLWALLKSKVAGGFYAVGRPETGMFRRGPARLRY